jgi:hypothetical protein
VRRNAYRFLGGLALLLSGSCSSGATGRITGVLVTGGGPTAQVVSVPGQVIASGGGRRYTVRVPPSGRFALRVPPGTYRVMGSRPSASGPVPCPAPLPVHVDSGQIVSVRISCLQS